MKCTGNRPLETLEINKFKKSDNLLNNQIDNYSPLLNLPVFVCDILDNDKTLLEVFLNKSV